jgi:hypothetical protein
MDFLEESRQRWISLTVNFWKADGDQKGPHRRNFKMSSSSGWPDKRLEGLASRYLTEFLTKSRVGGHPQARATLGKTITLRRCAICKRVFENATADNYQRAAIPNSPPDNDSKDA